MNDVLVKINELYNELVIRSSALTKAEANVKAISDALMKDKKELDGRISSLKVREEEVKKYGTIESAHATLSKMKTDFFKDRQAVEAEKAELAKKSASVNSKQKELDQLMTLYKSKIVSVNKEHEELEKERKGLEAKIVAQFTKSLTGK